MGTGLKWAIITLEKRLGKGESRFVVDSFCLASRKVLLTPFTRRYDMMTPSFRDLLHYKYRSSTKAKKQRRKQGQDHYGGDSNDAKKKGKAVPKCENFQANAITRSQGKRHGRL